jgi:hypothetical protein
MYGRISVCGHTTNMLIPAANILWCRHQRPVLEATVVRQSHTVLIKVRFVKTNEIRTSCLVIKPLDSSSSYSSDALDYGVSIK